MGAGVRSDYMAGSMKGTEVIRSDEAGLPNEVGRDEEMSAPPESHQSVGDVTRRHAAVIECQQHRAMPSGRERPVGYHRHVEAGRRERSEMGFEYVPVELVSKDSGSRKAARIVRAAPHDVVVEKSDRGLEH